MDKLRYIAINKFSLSSLGRSPSRFDLNKLKNINSYFMNKVSINDVANIFKKELDYKRFSSWFFRFHDYNKFRTGKITRTYFSF